MLLVQVRAPPFGGSVTVARCACGGSECSCVVQSGQGTTVTGTGSAANPYVVDAHTDCAAARQCLSAGCGITYNASTGQISADVSGTAGNNVVCDAGGLYATTNCAQVRTCFTATQGATYDPATGTFRTCRSTDANNILTYGTDGCLYVPAAGGTVTSGCGTTGNGSPADPIRLNAAAWPYACDIATQGGGIFCDPATGVAKGEPPVRMAFFGQTFNRSYSPAVAVPAVATDVETFGVTVTNPDPCRAAKVIIARQGDVDINLPPGAGAMTGIEGDQMTYDFNSGSTTQSLIHHQFVKMGAGTLAAGATTTYDTRILVGRGTNGATYERIQADIHVWIISNP